jgi:hypothetical protein
VDLATTRAQAKGVAPAICHEESYCLTFARAGQNVAATAMLLDMLPPASTDEVDRLYHQLGEILAIATMQQAECARWRRARESTSSLGRSRVDWRKTVVEPSMAKIAPSPVWV